METEDRLKFNQNKIKYSLLLKILPYLLIFFGIIFFLFGLISLIQWFPSLRVSHIEVPFYADMAYALITILSAFTLAAGLRISSKIRSSQSLSVFYAKGGWVLLFMLFLSVLIVVTLVTGAIYDNMLKTIVY